MDPTIVVAVITGIGGILSCIVSRAMFPGTRPPPRWSPPEGLTRADLDWVNWHLNRAGQPWQRLPEAELRPGALVIGTLGL